MLGRDKSAGCLAYSQLRWAWLDVSLNSSLSVGIFSFVCLCRICPCTATCLFGKEFLAKDVPMALMTIIDHLNRISAFLREVGSADIVAGSQLGIWDGAEEELLNT